VPDKKATRQQMNIFQRIWDSLRNFTRETVGELRKVSWPTRKETLHLTGIVLIVIALMAIILGVLDALYSQLMGLLI